MNFVNIELNFGQYLTKPIQIGYGLMGFIIIFYVFLIYLRSFNP